MLVSMESVSLRLYSDAYRPTDTGKHPNINVVTQIPLKLRGGGKRFQTRTDVPNFVRNMENTYFQFLVTNQTEHTVGYTYS